MGTRRSREAMTIAVDQVDGFLGGLQAVGHHRARPRGR
jgi:hypothetical protein